MPCVEVIESIIKHMDDSHLVLHSESGRQLATYYGEDMHIYYNMINPTEYENVNLYRRWATLDIVDVIKSWCREPSKFHHHPSTVYRTGYSYMYINT